jgi:DNA-directed RNA polymerase specialized sigma subunit
VKLIEPAFSEMVNKIIFTYKFNTLPNIDPLRDDCKIWLTTILDKYDPNKGSKAFSYFSVVTKNWFIHKVKKNSKKLKKEVSFEELVSSGGPDTLGTSDQTNDYVVQRTEMEFWNSLLFQLDKWDTGMLKANEKVVLDAVKVLMHNIDDIEIFNKKAVYLYLRELTGLNTKQVVNNLNKLRDRYRMFKCKWDKE